METSSLTVNEYLSQNEILEILDNIESGYKSTKSAFFKDGNKLLKPFAVQGVLTVEDEEDHHIRNFITCNVFGCKQTFETVFAFESHYNTLHRYLCSICKKNLPSSYFLDLHLSEQHDSFFAAQAERKPMYSCLIQECKEKFANPEERKDHCFRLHKFPTNFRFDSSTTLTGAMQKGKPTENQMDISPSSSRSNSLCDSKEILTPFAKNTNFSFGHQRIKAFNSNNYAKVLTKHKSKNHETNKVKSLLNEDNKLVDDLMESLPINN